MWNSFTGIVNANKTDLLNRLHSGVHFNGLCGGRLESEI